MAKLQAKKALNTLLSSVATTAKAYKALGTVLAKGNSTITQKYSFADQSPFMSTTNLLSAC